MSTATRMERSAFSRSTPIEVRLWSQVIRAEAPDACWPWVGLKTPDGYGWIRFRGRMKRAHQVAYILTFGEPPEGHHVLHHCDNRPCCRPDHLFTGTNADNVRDRHAKGRSVVPPQPRTEQRPRGERVAGARLTAVEVAEIRRRHSQGGVSQRSLADEFRVDYSTLSLIIRRRTWRHVP